MHASPQAKLRRASFPYPQALLQRAGTLGESLRWWVGRGLTQGSQRAGLAHATQTAIHLVGLACWIDRPAGDCPLSVISPITVNNPPRAGESALTSASVLATAAWSMPWVPLRA